jgi:putative endonuclease
MSEANTAPDEKRYFCYMLACVNGAFYTGWTTDPERRFKQHCSGKGSSYTKMNPPLKIAYIEQKENRHDAMIRELELKKLPHRKKKDLALLWEENRRMEDSQ